MKSVINKNMTIKKALFLLLLLFVVTFLLRWVYEVYFSNNDIVINYNYSNYEYESVELSRVVNVATDKISQKDYTGQEITIDQKYEKTAEVSANSSDFNDDNQRLRQIIQDNDAVIQMERLRGLEGSQTLTMTIGVIPERFDDIVESIKAIGNLNSFAVNKVDKTAEFRNLMAEQETLKKTRESYLAIKEKGGTIQDLLLLEDKILEVERNLQDLGVDIGLYSSDNSFCTVNFTLNETGLPQISIRFLFTCAKRSFFWTTAATAIGLFSVFMALAAVSAILKLLEYIKKAAGSVSEEKKE